MEKKILRLQKKTERAFSLFHKMIAKLLKLNSKLEKMFIKADNDLQEKKQEFLEAEEKIGGHINSIMDMINANKKQIETLKKFTGKVDE